MEFEKVALVLLSLIAFAILARMAYNYLPEPSTYQGGKAGFIPFIEDFSERCRGECEAVVILEEEIRPSDLEGIAILRQPIKPGKHRIIVIREGGKTEIVVEA